MEADKLYWRNIENSENLLTRVLQVHNLSEQYPNSGSIEKGLVEIYDKLKAQTLLTDDELWKIASVIADIAYNNPRTYRMTVSILGVIASLFDADNTNRLFRSLINKFSDVPNSEYFNIWLQRLMKQSPHLNLGDGNLCEYVRKCFREKKPIDLKDIWNYKNRTHYNEFVKIMRATPIVDLNKLEEMPAYPSDTEIKTFLPTYF